MILTKEEREKFAAWCEQEAFAEDGLAKQMDLLKLPTAQIYRQKAIAKILVAKELRSIEEF